MIEKIFTYIGYLSTFLGVILLILKITNFFNQKAKIGLSYNKLRLSCNNLLYQKNIDKEFINKLILETSYQINENKIEKKYNDPIYIELRQYNFKNIGKKIIKGNDFYNAEKLGIIIDSNFICAGINNITPNYINASINVLKDKIEINFDVLKPNDIISILVIVYNEYNFECSHSVLGKSEDINKIIPLDIYTADEFYKLSSFFEKEKLYYKEGIKLILKSIFFPFFCFLLFYIIYIELIKLWCLK